MNIPESVATVARPGDTILITFGDRMTDEELSEMTGDLQGFFEETGVHIALLEGVHSVVVIRKAGDDADEE